VVHRSLGAAKTTIAEIVQKELRERGRRVEVLDGSIVRTNLSKGLSFSRQDRNTNVLRIGLVAELLTRNGVGVIVSAISPFKEACGQVRRRIIDFIGSSWTPDRGLRRARDVMFLVQTRG